METDFTMLLINTGVAGSVLAWFMLRLEKKLEKLDLTLQDLNFNIKSRKK